MGVLDTLKSLVTWQPLPPVPPARKSLALFEQGDYLRPAWADSITYNTGIDYKAEAGDLGTNGIIMACIGWLMRAEPEAPWRLHRRTHGTPRRMQRRSRP